MRTALPRQPLPERGRGPGSPAKRRRGFTLVEIIVAVTLLAIMATALTSYNTYVSRARIVAKQRALALIAAEEAIDNVRGQAFDSITVGVQHVVSTLGDIPLTVTTTIQLSQINMKLVAVSVANSQGKVLQTFVTAVFKVR